MAMKKRIIIAGQRLETNSFSPFPTTKEDYMKCEYGEKERLFEISRGVSSELGAFIDIYSEMEDVEMLPVYQANTIPKGTMTRETFDWLVNRYFEIYDEYEKEGPIDGILFAFHGAMIVEDAEDGEGLFLQKIRERKGYDIPIIITLDFHANLTEEMVKYSNGVFTAQSYPHVDFYEQGVRAAHLMLDLIDGKAHTTAAYKHLPIMYPQMPTCIPPLDRLMPLLRAEEEAEDVYNCQLVAGFCRADVSIQGISLYALTENNPEKAEALVKKYAADVIDHIDEYVLDCPDPETAIKKAMADPAQTLFADGADNPGSGLTGDATEIIHLLLKLGATNVGVSSICDPETVQQAFEAGVGATIHVRLGGKSSDKVGAPVEVDATVLHLSDGEIKLTGPMSTGMIRHCGPSATLEFNGIKCIVITKRNQTHDEQMFRYNGVEPLSLHIIVLKSIVHFRAAYELIIPRDHIIMLDMPNLTPADDRKVDFKHLKHPIWPFERITKEDVGL